MRLAPPVYSRGHFILELNLSTAKAPVNAHWVLYVDEFTFSVSLLVEFIIVVDS